MTQTQTPGQPSCCDDDVIGPSGCDIVKILDRQIRLWSKVHNPNVSHVKGDLTINWWRESLGYPKLKATAAAVTGCVLFDRQRCWLRVRCGGK